jgi:hypothetical protein
MLNKVSEGWTVNVSAKCQLFKKGQRGDTLARERFDEDLNWKAHESAVFVFAIGFV